MHVVVSGALYRPKGTGALEFLYSTDRVFFSTITFKKCIFALDNVLYCHTRIGDQLINRFWGRKL